VRVRGFTLIEVVLATTILALVMSLVFSTFFAQNRVERATRSETEAAQSARIFLDLLLADINQVVAPGTPGLDEPGLIGSPQEDGRFLGHELTLITRTGMGSGADRGLSGMGEPVLRVVYKTQPGHNPDGTPTGDLSLLRRVESLLGEEVREETVCPGVASFRLTYLDPKAQESGSWSDQKKLPPGIRVELALAPGEGTPATFTLVCGPLAALAWKKAK
jgi:prepilin-type N-terminal cleavage/methylation domain-containing protein